MQSLDLEYWIVLYAIIRPGYWIVLNAIIIPGVLDSFVCNHYTGVIE